MYLITKTLFALEFNNNNFRPVIEPNGDNTVADTPAHYHGRIVFGVLPGIIFREKALIRRNNSSNKGQSELPAMRMSAYSQIHRR